MHCKWVTISKRTLQGISVTLDDSTSRCYYGCLVCFLGDTPASALVGGFKEGVGGAYRCCSTCMITSDELSSVVSYLINLYHSIQNFFILIQLV